ncbi:hypothetical protein H4R26_000370 [Coemansia thaxteri]|uniref:Ribosomal protein L10 n=1 Tax=Coemansia thaxteri TaxID=2663907 RepID=A0A9W8BIU7_9FUNG|nr:hypothetical protein H4R26_000370 [Coemansia thaxteri]KAJ2486309.1 hypothetical protein EV174_001180 [Coemansia sp. RSA 2320]
MQCRSMASESATASQALNPKLERSHPPKSMTMYKKPFAQRKQYLFSEYEGQFVSSPAVVVVQHHNLNGSEQLDYRRELKVNAQGARLMIVRSKMIKAVLRNTRFTNLGSLFSGPTAIVYWEAAERDGFDSMLAVKQAMDLTKKQKRVVLMGAKYGDTLLNPAMMKEFVGLPHIDQLRAQVLGVIQSPAQQLTSVLQRIPQRLVGVLEQRANGDGEAKAK